MAGSSEVSQPQVEVYVNDTERPLQWPYQQETLFTHTRMAHQILHRMLPTEQVPGASQTSAVGLLLSNSLQHPMKHPDHHGIFNNSALGECVVSKHD